MCDDYSAMSDSDIRGLIMRLTSIMDTRMRMARLEEGYEKESTTGIEAKENEAAGRTAKFVLRQSTLNPGKKPLPQDDDDKFVLPKTPFKKPKMRNNPPLNLTNSFDVLGEASVVEMEMETENSKTQEEMKHNNETNGPQNNQKTAKKPTGAKPTAPKTERITPIIIRQKEKWSSIQQAMDRQNIYFTKAKLVKTGILVEPASEDDYRQTNY